MNEQKLIKILANSVFIFLFIYAFYFYLERLNSDTSFFTFKILNFEKFNIEAGRYATFITQIIPLVLLKLHASLKTILIGYSVSFVIINYLFFLTNLYAFKSIKAALATTILLFLGVSDTSFYAVTEIFFGMMGVTSFYGFLEYFLNNEKKFTEVKKRVLFLLGIILIVICMFSHPSTLFPVLFVLGFQLVDKKIYKNKTIYLFLLITIIVYGLKYLSIDKNSYEGDQIAPFYNFFSIIKNFTHINSFHFFIKFVLKGIYVLPIILLVINMIHNYLKGEYIKLLYISVATAGFFILLMVIFSRGDSDLGMEKNLIPLWIFIALPFIHDVLFQEFRHKFSRALIYSIIVISGLSGFYRAAKFSVERSRYLKKIIEVASDTTSSNKIIIEKKNLDMDKLAGTWSIANETLLMSSVEEQEESKTIYMVDNLEQLKDFDFKKTDVYLCVPFWLEWNYSSLNQQFFKLKLEPYSVYGEPIHFE